MSRPRGLADRPLIQLTLVRFREFWREPEAVFWAFVFPILLTAGLSLAFKNRPADALHIGATSAELARPLASEPSLSVALVTRAEGDHQLATGKIALLAVRDSDGETTLRYDDTNPDGRLARLLAERAVQKASGGPAVAATRVSLLREPGARYVDFLVPGLLGMTLMGNGIWGVGFPIVDARRKRLLKRLVASPMSRAHYLLSFLLARLGLLLAEVLVLVGFATIVFDVPVRGPLWQLALVALQGALTFGAIGLLIAARAQTLEGASGLMNFVMLPMWLFSGTFFSAERFPAALQPLIQALPLTAVNDALRATMIEGASLVHIGGEILITAAWLLVCFPVALRIFRWL